MDENSEQQVGDFAGVASEVEKPLVAVARLDADGVYQGIDMIAEDLAGEDHVLLLDGCDLPSGRYAWDKSAATFVPLEGLRAPSAEQPLAADALVAALLELHARATAMLTAYLAARTGDHP